MWNLSFYIQLKQIKAIAGRGPHSCLLIRLHKGMVMCWKALVSRCLSVSAKKKSYQRSHSMEGQRVNEANSAGPHSWVQPNRSVLYISSFYMLVFISLWLCNSFSFCFLLFENMAPLMWLSNCIFLYIPTVKPSKKLLFSFRLFTCAFASSHNVSPFGFLLLCQLVLYRITFNLYWETYFVVLLPR